MYGAHQEFEDSTIIVHRYLYPLQDERLAGKSYNVRRGSHPRLRIALYQLTSRAGDSAGLTIQNMYEIVSNHAISKFRDLAASAALYDTRFIN